MLARVGSTSSQSVLWEHLPAFEVEMISCDVTTDEKIKCGNVESS